jgi:hypothetical protein
MGGGVTLQCWVQTFTRFLQTHPQLWAILSVPLKVGGCKAAEYAAEHHLLRCSNELMRWHFRGGDVTVTLLHIWLLCCRIHCTPTTCHSCTQCMVSDSSHQLMQCSPLSCLMLSKQPDAIADKAWSSHPACLPCRITCCGCRSLP